MDYILPKMLLDIEALPYFEGEAFERACQEVFENNGFVNVAVNGEDPLNKKDYPLDKEWVKTDLFENMEILDLYSDHLYYIYQPCGISSPPDFLLLIYGRVVPFECKSSTSRKYRFNNTLPHETTIYAFSDKHHNKTRLAMGSDLIVPDTRENIEEITRRELKDAYARIRKQIKNVDGNPYGFGGYGRVQFDQHGGYPNTDFITLSEEKNWKKGVFGHIIRELAKSDYFELSDTLL